MRVKRRTRYLIGAVCVILASFGLAGCFNNDAGDQAAKKGGQTALKEQEAVQTGFNRLALAQQLPTFDWSQERQTLIDVQTIRATGAVSTAMGYLEGVGLIWWCPAKGAPVPSSYQLSGKGQWVDLPGDESRARYKIDQGEPTGVYVGGSSGTWVLCVDDEGKAFAQYWEGYINVTVGVVEGLDPAKRVTVDRYTFDVKNDPNK